MGSSLTDPELRADGLRAAFQKPQRFPRRLFTFLAVLLLLFVAALVGRAGTDLARSAGAGLLVLGAGMLIFRALRWRKLWADPERSLAQALGGLGDEVSGRAVRAYRLAARLRHSGAGDESESKELAALHLSRIFDSLSVEQIKKRAHQRRRRGLGLAFLMCAVCFWILTFRALLVVEGVDVLLARNGVGPFPLSYVEDLRVTAELPAYLDGTGQKRQVSSRLTAVPEGSEVEVRVVPRVSGRKLLLTDGVSEAPFVSDGQGGFVARWVAVDPSSLRVAARFGQVLLFDHLETQLAPLADRGPAVILEGAPRSLPLEEMKSLQLAFTAADDHGLSQVDLVLKSGQRSHREELVHLDGQRRMYSGAHVVTQEHEFLKKAFLPVRISIEARDGNTASGPSWGRSQVITLVPPPLGHEVRLRHLAFRAFRGLVVDYLASEIETSRLSGTTAKEARKAATVALTQGFQELSSELSELSQVPTRSLTFLEAQVEALSRKGGERATAEAVLLATDVLIENVATSEAQSLSRDLGSAVEELAVLLREFVQNPEDLSRDGFDDLVQGVRQGALQLLEVGHLGLDLGAVAVADLARIQGQLKKGDFPGAEAAAHHLAERLKRATPSFGSKGGGAEAGLPSGAGPSSEAGGEPSPHSEAPGEFERLSQQLDELAQDNAQSLYDLERLMREAARAAKDDFEPTDRLREATEALRDALGQLPQSAEGTVGVRAESANARSEGEAMADALGAGDLVEAIERGKLAEESIRRAESMARERPGWVSEEALRDAQKALAEAIEEARRLSDQSLGQQGSRARQELSDAATKREELGRRALELAQKGRRPESPLSEESLRSLNRAAELLRDAASELRQGNSDRGIQRSREAQHALEEAMPEAEGAPGDSESFGDGGGEADPSAGHVPDQDKDRAREFRQRVEDGLGRASGRLSPAVRRYAEELK